MLVNVTVPVDGDDVWLLLGREEICIDAASVVIEAARGRRRERKRMMMAVWKSCRRKKETEYLIPYIPLPPIN